MTNSDRGREGVKNPENLADVICTCPLKELNDTPFHQTFSPFQALFLTVVTQVTVRLEHSSERLNTLETQANCVAT